MVTPSRSQAYGAAVFLFLVIVSTAHAKYSGGTGEPNDPYQIATAADLIALGETPEDYDKHFLLTADIDLDPNLPGRKVFDKAVIAPDIDPVKAGSQGTPFTGVFDGNGHVISHLTITGGSYLGLFGQLQPPSQIENLGVVATNIGGSDYIGGLVGFCEPSWGGITWCGISITRCHSSGSVSGSTSVGGLAGESYRDISSSYSAASVNGTQRIGGLVGHNCAAITASYSIGQVSGGEDVGGLVGRNLSFHPAFSFRRPHGSIATSYSSSTVSGDRSVGGLVGYNSSYARIRNCHSSGSVSGSTGVGGLAGLSSGDISSSYSTGSVSGTGDYVGALVGYAEWGSISLSFWDIQTSGQITSAGGTGKTTVEMQSAPTFLDAGWDFVNETANGTEDIWKIAEGLGYPRLAWEKYSGGTGEPNDPYQIATAADLIALGETPEDYDKHFILTADIDLDPNLPGRKVFDKAVIAPDTNDTEAGFQGTAFTGVFDGNGHTIPHLTIKGGSCLGLFGCLRSGAEVKDVGVVDVNVTGVGHLVGGLAGYNVSGAVVTHCYCTGTVGGNSHVGGLASCNGKSSPPAAITRCYSAAVVTGISNVGGLVGYNSVYVSQSCSTGVVYGVSNVGGLIGANGWGMRYTGHVSECYSTCTVNGNECIGGLVGTNRGSVTRCYGTGSVIGVRWVGGIVGLSYGPVSESYSTGEVKGSLDVGGLVGANTKTTWGSEGTVAACFWDIQTSGQATNDGGTGKTTAEMQTAKTFLDAGWDFVDETANGTDDIWWIDEGLDYPRLWWEPYDGRVTVALGQVFTVTLESNPSTGYRWEWVDHQDSIVEQMGEARFKPRATGDPPLGGAGGWESFDFKAVHPGQMTLKLVYRRPWEEGVEPLKTLSLQVTVP
ncbi:MAG: protease inhibitor I42 family protein [Phycisphaerae bacterium]|nr:protease inhibitor I42 family protein [Phycisphaerae bacterium]